MEVWRRLHLQHSDLHYRVLGAWLCELLKKDLSTDYADFANNSIKSDAEF